MTTTQINRLGFLIPEFPQQTHVAWWRVSEAMRGTGIQVDLLSTRRPALPCPHPQLTQAAARTVYLWPPTIEDVAAGARVARRVPKLLRYVAMLRDVRRTGKLRAFALCAAAVRLHRVAMQRSLTHIFVHSCADAAHVVALTRLLGGPPYSLRLGGDLEVYGGDHAVKMSRATLVVPAARSYERRLVDEVGVAADRVMWSWVGTDTTWFFPPAERSIDGPLQVITVARLNVAKGYQVALPALARLRDLGVSFRYRIVGAGPYMGAIEQLVADLRLGAYVELLGSRSSAEVAELLHQSDLFLLPTCGIGEGTPAAICEAMSSGLPILATDVGGVTDMIRDGVHGRVVPPGDADALARALIHLASDRAALRRMGDAARLRAVEEFDVNRIAVRILDKIANLTPPR